MYATLTFRSQAIRFTVFAMNRQPFDHETLYSSSPRPGFP